MHRFLKAVFLFLLPLLVLAYPLDLGLSHLLRNKTGKYSGELEVWNDIYDSKIDSDIVIYGSSRAWTHFNSELLQDGLGLSVYNLGLDAHDFWLQYLRHRQFLARNRKPGVIVLSLDSFCLVKRADFYNYTQIMPFMLWDPFVFSHTKDYVGFERMDYFMPLARYMGETEALESCVSVLLPFGNRKKLRTRGFAAKNLPWTADFDNAKDAIGQLEIAMGEASKALLRKFLKECEDDGIEVIFVYSPDYIDGQKFIKNREEVMSFFRKTAEDFGIDFFDYSNHPICLDRRYFYNSTHLNGAGADLFSRELARDLAGNKRIMEMKSKR